MSGILKSVQAMGTLLCALVVLREQECKEEEEQSIQHLVRLCLGIFVVDLRHRRLRRPVSL